MALRALLNRRLDQRYDWPAVLVLMLALGTWEGLRPVPDGGDVLAMWAVLAVVLALVLVLALGWRHALAFAPAALALQDAGSTLAQGLAPVRQQWYCKRFAWLPDEACWTGLGYPAWWAAFLLASVLLDALADHLQRRADRELTAWTRVPTTKPKRGNQK